MSKQSDLIKNTAILAVGKVATQFIGFLLLPLYTLFLTPTEYGFVDLLTTYITLLIPALTLQLEMASFRFLIETRKDESLRPKIVSNILYLFMPLLAATILIVATLGVMFGFSYTMPVILAGFAIANANICLQIARGLGSNKQFAIASIIIGATTAITAIWFIAVADLKINGMLYSIATANITGALYLIVKMRLYCYVKFGLRDKMLQREILGYSTPLVPNGVAWWVISASDRTIITLMISVAANGIYAVSSKYAAIFSSLFGIFSMSWTESASLHIDSKDRDQFFSSVSNSAIRLFGALGLGLIAAIPFIFSWFVNDSFAESYIYIPILVIGAFFNAVVGLYSAVYVAKRLTKQVMHTSLIAAGLNIVLTIGLIPFFGLYAAAGATAAAFLAMAIFRHYDVKKYVVITYEKYVFIILAALYAIVMALYYMDNLGASISALLIALGATYFLNRREFGRISSMILGRIKK